MEPVSDRPRRSFGTVRYIFWAMIIVFVVYPLSAFPVGLVCMWLESWGLAPRGRLESYYLTFYAPIAWVIENSPAASKVMETISKPFLNAAPPPPP